MARFAVDCSECGALCYVSAPGTTTICADCVREMTAPPTIIAKKETGYPKGWRFMKEFVHASGKVFHKGVEQPELFGKLDVTQIVVKEKVSKQDKKQRREKALAEIVKLKKELKKETRKTYIKKLESQINKLQKEV